MLLLHQHLVAVHYLFLRQLIEALLAGHGDHGSLQHLIRLVHLLHLLRVLNNELLQEGPQLRLLAVDLINDLGESLGGDRSKHVFQLQVDVLVLKCLLLELVLDMGCQ